MVASVVVVQSLEDSVKGEAGVLRLTRMSAAEVKVWVVVERFVMVMVRRMGALEEVWMPKSSSRGEKAMGVGVVVMAGREAVWVVALSAAAVRVPGPEPVRAMVHSAPAGRVVGQVVARVKAVAVSWRLVAAVVLRLRRMMSGEAPIGEGKGGVGGAGRELGEVGGGAGAERFRYRQLAGRAASLDGGGEEGRRRRWQGGDRSAGCRGGWSWSVGLKDSGEEGLAGEVGGEGGEGDWGRWRWRRWCWRGRRTRAVWSMVPVEVMRAA